MDHDEFIKRLSQPVHFKSDPSEEVNAQFISLESSVSSRLASVGYAALTAREKAVHNVYWLICEVMNGGFHQYFWNSAGDYALDTLEALRQIGSIETLNITNDACALFPDGKPDDDRLLRQDQLEAFDDPATEYLTPEYEITFGELDRRFYEREEELEGLCLNFWAESQV